MSATPIIPTRDEFLFAPVETVAEVAPCSMVYAPGGTRRSATFAGIEPWSAAHVRETQKRFVDCLDVIFRYGVAHVFTPMIMVGHLMEATGSEQHLMLRMGEFATDPYLLDMVAEHKWRIKLAPSGFNDVLQPYIDCLDRLAPTTVTHTWWLTVTPSYESWWSSLIAAAKSDCVGTRSDAICALYGEAVPPIELCFAFGKPMISPDLFPPLLMDNVQCYWSQQAGYSLTDQQFRQVLYDFAFLRKTWQKDKAARARAASAHQQIWEREVIVGLGKRLGPFWYPSFPNESDG